MEFISIHQVGLITSNFGRVKFLSLVISVTAISEEQTTWRNWRSYPYNWCICRIVGVECSLKKYDDYAACDDVIYIRSFMTEN